MNKYQYVLLIVLLYACHDKNSEKHEHKLSIFATDPIKKRDSLQDAFYKNKYFLPTVIRLDRNDKEAFISIDSPYFQTTRLDNNNREVYYTKVIALQPKEDIQVYYIIWQVPEMRKMQTADGGYGTLVANITKRPDKENPYYVVEIRINNIDEMPPANDISSFRIQLNPLQVALSDQSGYYVSLEEWEHVNQTK